MADPFYWSRTSLFARRFERHDLCGKDAALGIHRLDQHLVLAARQVNPDDEVALATSAALWAKALVAIGPPFQTLPRRSQNHSPGIY
jgi:hypothetical protein